MTREFAVTKHAAERFLERIGQPGKADVKLHIKQLMQSAEYQGASTHEEHGRRIYDHQKKRIRFVVDLKEDKVITVYPMNEPLDVLRHLPDDLAEVIRKRARSLIKKKVTEQRRIKRQVATFELKIAEKRLNRLNVNNPKTKSSIDRQITELLKIRDELVSKRHAIEHEINQLSKHE